MDQALDRNRYFSIGAGTFLGAVTMARRAIIAKPVVPAYENLRFDIRGGMMSVTGSDGQTTITVRREIAEGAFEGSFLVMPQFVNDIIKGLSFQRLTFAVSGGRMDVSWDDGSFSVPVFEDNDWPETEPVKGEVRSATMQSDDLRAAIDLVKDGCAKDEVRPQLCGIYFDFLGEDKGLKMVSTDAYVLVVADVPNAYAPAAFSFTLPRKTAEELKAHIPEGYDVSITRDDSSATFTCEDAGIIIRGRLLEGKFPVWQSVIPKRFAAKAELPRVSLVASVVRLGACSGPGKVVLLEFSQSGLDLSAQDIGMSAEGQEHLVCAFEGEAPLKICFNHERLKRVLDNLPGTRLLCRMNDGKTGVVLKDADDLAGKKKKQKGIKVFALMIPTMGPGE